MRIKDLRLENFRGFEKLDIEFPEDSNVAVFVGTNGSGKTTVLDAIKVNLGQYIRHAFYYAPEFDTLANEKDIRLGSENGAIWGISVLQNNGENISIQNGILSEYSNATHGDMQKYEVNDNIPIMIFYGSKMYRESDGSMPKFTHLQHLANYNSLNAPITNFIDFIKWFELESDLQDKQKLATKNFDFVSKKISAVSIAIVKFLNEIAEDDFFNFRLENVPLPPQHIYDAPSKNILIIDKNNQTFEIETNLSEGEKMLIQLIADITRRLTLANPSLDNPLEGTGIILIDEIELHLHPKWQRNILPALTKTFPNIQFIVTTHSPQIVSSVSNKSVFVLKDNKLINNDLHNEGRDSNSILQEIFGVEKRPKEFSEKLAKIYSLIESEEPGKVEEAERILAELTEKWGEMDNDILRVKLFLQDVIDEIEA